MSQKHSGRVAIVTGCNVGLGVEIARMLAGAEITAEARAAAERLIRAAS